MQKISKNHAGERLRLCVSRLAEEKNCEFLIYSFLHVAKCMPVAKLLIVGGGPQGSKLRYIAQKIGLSYNVTFTGFIPHSEISIFYKISEILLFVSQTETQGLSLVESLYFRLSIVAVSSSASEELVKKPNT